jgi:hypothetical protein
MAGSAQTKTMTAIVTHATRVLAATPVQITMSATIISVRKAKPAIRIIESLDRTQLMVEGSNHRNPSVSNTLETRKILGRILMSTSFLFLAQNRAISLPSLATKAEVIH